MAYPTPKAVAKHTSANLFRYPVAHLVTNPFQFFFALGVSHLATTKKYS